MFTNKIIKHKYICKHTKVSPTDNLTYKHTSCQGRYSKQRQACSGYMYYLHLLTPKVEYGI